MTDDVSRDAHFVHGMMWAAYDTGGEPVDPERINALADWGDEKVARHCEELVTAGLAEEHDGEYVPLPEVQS